MRGPSSSPSRVARGALLAASLVVTGSVASIASAAPLVIAPSYPQRVAGRPPAAGINRTECVSSLEAWRFSFELPAVTFGELRVYARKTPGSCLAPATRAAGGDCHLVGRFAAGDVGAGPIDVPSAAMITAADLGVDADLAALDRDKACYRDGDQSKAALTLSMLLFEGTDVAPGADEATYATTYDLGAPDSPPDFAATADSRVVHTSWTPLSSTTSVKALDVFCFDLDATGDAGDAPCAIPSGFLVHDRFVAPGFDGLVCASAAPNAGSLDITGLIPGHHYVFTMGVVDDDDNSGALAAPSCVHLGAVTPVDSDAGPPELPPVSACNCEAVGAMRAASWSWSFGGVALLGLLVVACRARARKAD